jgi:hypothetical protein
MTTSALTEDADGLIALGQGIATVISEKREDLGIGRDVEALLRASISAATFAVNRYMAVLAGAAKSPAALVHLKDARERCDASARQLRRRVMRSIAELCRKMTHHELCTPCR